MLLYILIHFRIFIFLCFGRKMTIFAKIVDFCDFFAKKFWAKKSKIRNCASQRIPKIHLWLVKFNQNVFQKWRSCPILGRFGPKSPNTCQIWQPMSSESSKSHSNPWNIRYNYKYNIIIDAIEDFEWEQDLNWPESGILIRPYKINKSGRV